MKYLQGQNREQTYLFPVSLNDAVDAENEVRLIDVFVNSLNLEDFGFRLDHIDNGRPAYHPSDLLKLYIYGYMNRVRSSRQLEKESKRNIEVMWLLKNLQPDHNTISNFRRDNPKAIKRVFRETVRIAQYFHLIGGTLLAGDSTKLRAQNSKKNNYNQKKIDRHQEYIENKLAEYEKALAENDGDNEEIKKGIKKQNQRKDNYKKLEQELKESGEPQLSTSDPESRHLITRNNITEVAYSAQTTVDAKNNIPIDYKITNTNDAKAMGEMLQRAKTILRSTNFTALYDKGYHTGSEFKIANELGIDVMVAIPTVAANAPNHKYNVENFVFDKEKDCYTCPEGEILTTNGRWHKAKTYRFKRYTTKACKRCKAKPECSAALCGKAIQRSEFQEYVDRNKNQIKENKELYRNRQQIVEHPYGTIKRQWGFNYIITKKGIQRASADFGFTMIAYNLRRLINIVGLKELGRYLVSIFSILCSRFAVFHLFLSQINQILKKTMNNPGIINQPLTGRNQSNITSPAMGF
ncbi:Transposase [Mariniphaga anaerophila]|uniref:Transposase n=1 Tax=Mariniphaga anaerophila TaxID=1484053 RepID=A0A1M5GW72_9BACT|nr:IS1182 family transposase [Mariniphaga anaerophila]SHG07855.1 Transposase [Mariniphaga anaerophila]